MKRAVFRIRRRAVALRGGVWYNFRRSSAMGSKTPAPERVERDNETLSAPRKRSIASRDMSYPFAGCGFAKWK